MAIASINKELYSFNINIQKTVQKEVEVEKEIEVEKEVEVERKRKNKETGKMEKVIETETRKVKEKVVETELRDVMEDSPVRVTLKKPTRTQLEDGDMFYSIWLNKYIKMGLLTRAMLAKQHLDVGGSLTEEEKQRYAQLYVRLYEKQQAVQRFGLKTPEERSNDENERLARAVEELGVIRKELTDFEAVQASMFDHTADIKARNKTITWYLLNLTHVTEGDHDDAEARPLFEGETYDDKYESYMELDEIDDPIYLSSIDKLSSLATIWYMSGVSTQEDFDRLLEEIDT